MYSQDAAGLFKAHGLTNGLFMFVPFKDGQIVLSVAFKNKVTHHLVGYTPETKSFSVNKKPTSASTLDELIQVLSKKSDWWPIALASGIAAEADTSPKPTSVAESVDSTSTPDVVNEQAPPTPTAVEQAPVEQVAAEQVAAAAEQVAEQAPPTPAAAAETEAVVAVAEVSNYEPMATPKAGKQPESAKPSPPKADVLGEFYHTTLSNKEGDGEYGNSGLHHQRQLSYSCFL
jgi:hypothetical protein